MGSATCIIFKGKVHIEGWYQDEVLPKDWRIESLKLVQMDGHLIRSGSNGLKISLFLVVQLESTASWFLMAMEAI